MIDGIGQVGDTAWAQTKNKKVLSVANTRRALWLNLIGKHKVIGSHGKLLGRDALVCSLRIFFC